MELKFALGWDRVSPTDKLFISKDGFCKCSKLQNYIVRNKKIEKIGGTKLYNGILLSAPISWAHRSYHKRADGSFRKVLFCFSNGAIYSGDDIGDTSGDEPLGLLTSRKSGFTPTAIPMSATIQVSGNSILHVYIGELLTDEVYKYDGNGSFTFEKTTINADMGRVVESATVHLDRMWYVSKNSAIIRPSRELYPEDFNSSYSADITVGQETDSVVRRCVVGANETMFVFKNQSIWQLYGRTKSEFQLRLVTNKYGLACKRGICAVGGGFIFLDEFSKELCFFGGTENSIIPLTEDCIRLREIIDTTQIEKVDMTVYDGLFRFSFKHKNDPIYPDSELIYAINEPGLDGLPMWSMSKGAKIYSYSVWNQQGDNELVTGKSDEGQLVYHNKSKQFDEVPIETIVRTPDVVASEGKIVRFSGFWIRGKPGSRAGSSILNIKFRYYLDGRYSTGSEDNILDMLGETRSIAGIRISTHSILNQRIIPYHKYSIANSISFEIYDNSLNTDIELESVSFKARERYKLRNELIGV